MQTTVTNKKRKRVRVAIPPEVMGAFRELKKQFEFQYDFVAHCGLSDLTIRNILKKKTCAPDTLDTLYRLTGIENPEKQAA